MQRAVNTCLLNKDSLKNIYVNGIVSISSVK